MEAELLKLMAQLLTAAQPPADCGCGTKCQPCLDPAAGLTFQHSMARYNDQSGAVAATFQQNLLNQQSANAAMLLKLTADLTHSGVKAVAGA